MRKKVLLVDDAIDHAQILKAVLEHSKLFEVVHTRSGLEAYQMLKSKEKFAMLVTGINLPGMTGYELLTRLNAEKINLPTLVLSQKQGQEDVMRGLSLGASYFVSKPFSPTDIMDKILKTLSAGAKP